MSESKTATERLRELLDERGVEYETNDETGVMETSWLGCTAFQLSPTAKMTMIATPEQAITATLGSDVHAGRLAERLHDFADEMRNTGASSMTPHELLAFFAREIDKMADSLMFAATLGSGTCKLEETESYNGWVHVLECSNCGQECEHVNGSYSYCPHCLARAVER